MHRMATNLPYRTQTNLIPYLTAKFGNGQALPESKPSKKLLKAEKPDSNNEPGSLRTTRLSLLKNSIRNQERKLIGQELHDNVNQILGIAKMLAEMMSPGSEKEKEIRNKLVEYVMLAVTEIRDLSRELVTNRKHMERLEEQIRKILNDLCYSNALTVDFTFDYRVEWLEEGRKLNLFRIVQEHLKNVMNYSKSKKINVSLALKDDHKIEMIIKDDGLGFDPIKVRRGIGLSNISDRAVSLGGNACIKSSPGKGCTLAVVFPFVEN